MSEIPDRINLAHLPTPLEPLPRLSEALNGPELWVKRDDMTGLAFGGNKTRKLEFLTADALSHNARTLITRGAAQSNHCRQTAAAARRCGLDCTLVLSGEPPQDVNGNLLLDNLLGATIVWTHGRDPDTVLRDTFNRLKDEGAEPCLIPYGGSNAIGACAYAFAIQELINQGEPFDRIVFASSSGGTQAGMAAGARLFGCSSEILGISVEPDSASLQQTVAGLASEVSALLGDPASFPPDSIHVNDSFLGRGYGVLSSLEPEAIRLFAQHEGLLLDPVYTGRAAGGLLALIRSGLIGKDERVLFWHTGGTPGLFAYATELLSKS